MTFRQMSNFRWAGLIFLLVVVYAVGFLCAYSFDVLARAPVLDAREMLVWAEKISSGQLPAEPLYRALLYPWILSLSPKPLIWAPVLGILCHLLNAFFVGLIARRIWKSSQAAMLSALLYGVYPVALYFSVQILDITFSLSLFLAGLYFLFSGAVNRPFFKLSLSGLFGGLAVLARPNFLPAVLLFPILAAYLFVVGGGSKKKGVVLFLISLCSLSIPLMLQGIGNLRLSGEFRVLPWQGAYSLYAANRGGVNGRYYSQRICFDDVPPGMNSTRMESEQLYRKEMGADAPLDVSQMGLYWRKQLLQDISNQPKQWLGLMLRKCVYVLNDWEQYNNLTYAYHKARFLLLRVNPLGWGVLLLASSLVLCFARMIANHERLMALILLILGYGAGLLLFFTSARFRLPLAPMLCILSGGLAALRWRQLSRVKVTKGIVILSVVAVVTYGNWCAARDTQTFVQDEFLLACSASRLCDDSTAVHYLEAAIEREPFRQDFLRLYVVSLFNLCLLDNEDSDSLWYRINQHVDLIHSSNSSIEFIRGISAWRSGKQSRAVEIWRSAVKIYGMQENLSAQILNAQGYEYYSIPETLDAGILNVIQQ